MKKEKKKEKKAVRRGNAIARDCDQKKKKKEKGKEKGAFFKSPSRFSATPPRDTARSRVSARMAVHRRLNARDPGRAARAPAPRARERMHKQIKGHKPTCASRARCFSIAFSLPGRPFTTGRARQGERAPAGHPGSSFTESAREVVVAAAAAAAAAEEERGLGRGGGRAGDRGRGVNIPLSLSVSE
jgi:hypothetical protein